MTDAFRDTLQITLGTSYTIERELGGGGMSRVFLADDVALGRRVVVKTVASELAEGVSIESGGAAVVTLQPALGGSQRPVAVPPCAVALRHVLMAPRAHRPVPFRVALDAKAR